MTQHFFKKNLFLGGFFSLFLGSSMVAPKDFGRYVCNFMPNYRVDLQIMAEKETYCLFDDYEKHPGNYSLNPIKEVAHSEEKAFYQPLGFKGYTGDNDYTMSYTIYEAFETLRLYDKKNVEINIEDLKQNFKNERDEIRHNFKNRPNYSVNENFFHDMYNHGIMHRPFILNHIFFKLLGSIWGNQELEGHFRHVIETYENNGPQASILRDVFKKTLSQKEYDFLINNYFFQECDGFKEKIEHDGLAFFDRNLNIEQEIINICKKIRTKDDVNSAKKEIDDKNYDLPYNTIFEGTRFIFEQNNLEVFPCFWDKELILGKDINDNDLFAFYGMGGNKVVFATMNRHFIYEHSQYFPYHDYKYFYDLDLEFTIDSMVMVSKKFHYEQACGEKYNDVKKILKKYFIVIEEQNIKAKKKLFNNFFIDLREKFIDLIKDTGNNIYEEIEATDSDEVEFSSGLYSTFFSTFLGILLGLDKDNFYDERMHILESNDHVDFTGYRLNVKNIWDHYIAKYLKEISAKVKNQEKQLQYFVQLKESLLHQGNIANYPYKGFTTNMSSLNIWDYLIDDFEDIYKIITFYKNNYNKYDEKDAASMNFLEDSIFMDLRSSLIPFFNNKIIDNLVNTIYRSLVPHIINIIKLDNILDAIKKNNPSLYMMRKNVFNEEKGMEEIKWQWIEGRDWMGAENVVQWGKKGEKIQENIREGAEKYKEEYVDWIMEDRMEETKDEKMEEERKEGEQKIIRVKPNKKIEQIVEKVLQNEHKASLGRKVNK